MSGSCGHSHSCEGHSHNAAESGEGWDLYKEVDKERCSALNETEAGSVKNILRPWEKRLDPEPVMVSDADEQLLIFLPFYSAVKITSISVIGSGGEQNPKTMKVFLNSETMDFPTAEATEPVQTWELVSDNSKGEVEYPTKITKFQNVRTMWIFISDNFGAEETSLQYIGLKGTASANRRQAVSAVYELQPQTADHKTNSEHFHPSIL
mmetsp:Transcript_6591/g.19966  ORF Transcript_6591/g.19966 Transcript_6591/m.19966 type:complete len:208 (+) Transcript_6591:131-754(+)|eukprot:CAMPEP_0198722796 /NCGR_PEP_ID=MMETSP1475-20131203/424_1 /TAXON_ID= ORGANISM="Unidentified sp., Strain CCMP1999" /NCGR_SAMPLE_ID=MMETSP1475 /ASSEMBLY_ACC=CAM_ASM_001111 /LENGTH=207 /DNA_ID=CAMNT_0044483719 /DNA_START=94 /DNA_END=717 /DNA_ORIENTATION=-